MKESTRKMFAMHGDRPDRVVHNYIYFKWYDKYVKYFLKAGRLLVLDVVKGLPLDTDIL